MTVQLVNPELENRPFVLVELDPIDISQNHPLVLVNSHQKKTLELPYISTLLNEPWKISNRWFGEG